MGTGSQCGDSGGYWLWAIEIDEDEEEEEEEDDEDGELDVAVVEKDRGKKPTVDGWARATARVGSLDTAVQVHLDDILAVVRAGQRQ